MSAFVRAENQPMSDHEHGVSTMHIALTSGPQTAPTVKRLNLFERYLTVWVGLCMVAGGLMGRLTPEIVQTFRDMEFGRNSHVNLPMAVLIWLMIIPMMMKVDFRAVAKVGQRPQGLLVTVHQLADQTLLDGLLGLVLLPIYLLTVDHTGRSRSIYRRVNYSRRCALYGHGLCLELPHRRRSGLYLGPGLRE